MAATTKRGWCHNWTAPTQLDVNADTYLRAYALQQKKMIATTYNDRRPNAKVAKRKAEEALPDREKALPDREKALPDREKPAVSQKSEEEHISIFTMRKGNMAAHRVLPFSSLPPSMKSQISLLCPDDDRQFQFNDVERAQIEALVYPSDDEDEDEDEDEVVRPKKIDEETWKSFFNSLLDAPLVEIGKGYIFAAVFMIDDDKAWKERS